MILSRRVALNGEYLDELHDWIVIRSIEENMPSESTGTINLMGGIGQRVTDHHWESMEVTVTFGIMINNRDMLARQALLDAVKIWALQKGWLTVNYRENRRLYVDSVSFESFNHWNWTEDFTITFTARSVPFWQMETPESVIVNSSSNTSRTLTVPGMATTVLDVEFVNISGMGIDTVQVSVPGRYIRCTGIGLGPGQTFAISHGADGILRITSGGRSVLANRAEGSHDDLYIAPGARTVSLSATRAGRITFSATGRFY